MKLQFILVSVIAVNLTGLAITSLRNYEAAASTFNSAIGISQHSIAQSLQNRERPIARVNPSRPIQIEVVNAGGASIICALTTPTSAERRVAPGGSTVFGSTQTSFLPLPIDFIAYPERENVGLSLYVFAENNRVRIVVSAATSDVPGNSSVNIDEQGDVYVY